MREVVNAIFYLVRTGCQWANLPRDYPHHDSVYYHYHKPGFPR
jgi:putative transposase